MTIELGRLLVVDDNEMNRDMLSRRLTRLGHTVDIAVDGNQALQMIEKQQFDLILLDIMMPDISGIDVLKNLRAKYSVAELPVIMVTAKDQSEDIVEALNLGANDYVTKPIDFPVVSARVQTQLTLRHLSKIKDEFISIASHDLKNPLTGIIGFASILKMKLEELGNTNEDMNLCVNRINVLTEVMRRIILDFLDFQAMEDGKLKIELSPVNLNDIAHMVVVNNFEYAKSKGIELALELDENLPKVSADTYRIQQVVENFAGNGIKFSESGSKVTIRSRVDSDNVILEVIDNGPGLTEDDLKKMFSKYARLSNKPTGGEKSSGLGLSICKNIIELHGGKIGARNNPEKGSTFWFELNISNEN